MADPHADQRLAAIMAADVAGYSRLMEADERATVATLDTYRAVFQERVTMHGGRIVDTAGDSVLAVFPSAISAVEAATDIQEDLGNRNETLPENQRMHFRIGVNLGDVIEKDDGSIYGSGVNVAARLEGLAEPGGICLSRSTHEQVEGKTDLGFEDIGEHEVKNIARPVRAYRVTGDHPVAANPSDDPALAIPTGPSIAVLPFDNMSADPEQEFFSDGITEDIITGLSRFQDIRVIARNSSFKYKGQSVDVRDVGQDLGVRYVLEGSVRKAGNRIRVSAQLLNAADGAHLWAETYDRDLSVSDIFDVQDEITSGAVQMIGGAYGVVARAALAESKRKPPDSLDAYECVLRYYEYGRVFTPEEHRRVRDHLERAVELDPGYVDAWSYLALMYCDEYKFDWNRRPDLYDSLDRALEFGRRAVNMDATSQIARMALAESFFFRGNISEFLDEAERAIALNPNNPSALAIIGFFIAYSGNWERGVAMIKKAATLNPAHPGWYHFPVVYDHYRREMYDEALAEARKIKMPDFYRTYVVLAAVNGQLGKAAEARAAADRLLSLDPDYPTRVRDDYRRWNFADDLIEHIIDGLRKAGLDIPEETPADD